MTSNFTQASQQLSRSPSSYRHHASFSEPSASVPQPPPVLRRESMTRLFLKPDAVFKAYEEIQQQQEIQRNTTPRIKRYTSMEDEPKASKSEDSVNVSFLFAKPINLIMGVS
jgi:hypothetical protein